MAESGDADEPVGARASDKQRLTALGFANIVKGFESGRKMLMSQLWVPVVVVVQRCSAADDSGSAKTAKAKRELCYLNFRK
jgi:hypothetical protein